MARRKHRWCDDRLAIGERKEVCVTRHQPIGPRDDQRRQNQFVVLSAGACTTTPAGSITSAM
jgi:hypothetical protein